MPILKILTYPNQILRNTSKPVENINGETQQLIDNMIETMYEAPGVGLAGIQVGCDQQIIVYDVAQKDGEKDCRILINPKIISKEGTMTSENEGCLSVPDFRSDVKRASQILVEAYDRHGNPLRFEASDFHAVVLQHEIDHLHGVLFIDHISALKRELYKRKIKKKLNK